MGDAVYALCGMRIRSSVELPLPEAPIEGWDVEVALGPDIQDSNDPPEGELIAEFEMPDQSWWYRAVVTDAGYCVRFRGQGDFLISHDHVRVVIRPDPAGHTELLPILMAGTVGALLLTLRGATVLHASAVAVSGSALAFIGQSGRGKTTLAALMCTSGAQLVSDDVLCVDPGPPVTCRGGATELRLRPAASALAQGPGLTTRTTADERVALTFDRPTWHALPLTAIVIPRPSRSAVKTEMTRLTQTTAICALLAFPRVHGWCRPDVLQRDFEVLSGMANSVPVYAATIPWGPPFSPDVIPALSAVLG